MFDRRLLGLVPGALRHVLLAVGLKWVSLLCDIALIGAVARSLALLASGFPADLAETLTVGLVACAAKAVATRLEGDQCFDASADVRRILRHEIYEKLLRLGPDYSVEVVQLAVEGTEQLETYFGRYLPQLFFSVLAPLTLFVVLLPVSAASSAVLLAFVPLIPLVIVLVQKVAKRTLAKYWDDYTTLGDSFLENLQGLTTLKIYRADKARHEAMNAESEHFRVITMKVLRMQLNSIIVMDVVALGGAAAGAAVALLSLASGSVDLDGCLRIILLSADFFLPMRLLGSYFHVAMNGMAAADKIFRVLGLPEPEDGSGASAEPGDHLSMKEVGFGYEEGREILHGVSLDVPAVGLTAIVGESGSGKSTVASLLAGRYGDYSGNLLLGGKQLRDFSRGDLARYVTTVPTSGYLFRGTVRDNLLMADPNATDDAMWSALGSVALSAFLRSQDGLETRVEQEGQNLSGGQRQRLVLARALLHDSPVYMLDEATSNIDAESEDAIMEAVRGIARYKAAVVISHRLANVVAARRIYVMESGRVVGVGTHEQLLSGCPTYRRLWESQQSLENFSRSDVLAGEMPAAPQGAADDGEGAADAGQE